MEPLRLPSVTRLPTVTRLPIVLWQACPEIVEVPISEVQAFRQSAEEATRKRFKPLAHLPLGTGFQARLAPRRNYSA